MRHPTTPADFERRFPGGWIPVPNLVDFVPRSGNGKKKHRSWAFRAVDPGIYGERLRVVSFGRQRVTRVEWITDFAERVEKARRAAAEPQQQRRPRRRPTRAARNGRTDAILARHGLASS